MLNKLWRVLEAGRVGRLIMMALVTGSTAYGFGGSNRSVLAAALIGVFLALGGFYLDYLADWKKDRASGKTLNPIAQGELSPAAGLVLVIVGTGTSGVLGLITNPWILLPCAGVIAIVGGMAIGFLNTPIFRALSLGAIQGCYVLIGSLAANRFGSGPLLIALFLFFAMTGGRVMGEVRDAPHDIQVKTVTIPQRYGLRSASIFLLANEVVAYGCALAGYWVGGFRTGYLYCILAIVIFGTAINLVFISRPVPKVADLTNKLSLGILGMLYVLAMVVGRR